MRNPYKVDPLIEVPLCLCKGQCCYFLYRVELSSVLLVFRHPGGNVLEWGWPGTSRVGIHSEMLVTCLIKSEVDDKHSLGVGWHSDVSVGCEMC